MCVVQSRATTGYDGLPRATTGYDGLRRATTGYDGLRRATTGYDGLRREMVLVLTFAPVLHDACAATRLLVFGEPHELEE
eukprot:2962886-Rhodomonas_salina.1